MKKERVEAKPIVLITGANKGIGLESARQLTHRGWQVVIGARNAKAGKSAVESLVKESGSATFLQLDVSNSISISQAVVQFGERFDHLDVLINNAGIYPDEGLSIVTIRREQLVDTFQTNTFGAIEVTQAFLAHLRKSKAARVINLSSGYGQLEGLSPDVPSYCLSKLTLNGATLMLSQALQGDRIAVNSICPGWVR